MRSVLLLLLLVFGVAVSLRAQGWEAGVGLGYSVANHPNFPPLRQPVAGASLAFYTPYRWVRAVGGDWRDWWRGARLSWRLYAQQLGNRQVLGNAWAFVPTMSMPLHSSGRLNFMLGWGLGRVGRRFEAVDNPANIALGAYWNAAALAGIDWRVWRGLSLRLMMLHFSNGGTATPNLGANVLSVGLSYQFGRLPATDTSGAKIERRRLRRQPLLRRGQIVAQCSYGMAARGRGGALFGVYGVSTGYTQALSRTYALTARLEYSYNQSAAEWHRYNSPQTASVLPFGRWALCLEQEWWLGRWAFVAGGGVFLHAHAEQTAWFSTRIGANFYPRSCLLHARHQCWLGLHVRANFGVAECVEMLVGYRF